MIGPPWAALSALLVLATLLLVSRAVRARAERVELEAAQAVVAERERSRAEAARRQQELAAQVHDVLAHSLSGVVVALQVAQAQAAAEGATPDLVARLAAARSLAGEGLDAAREAVAALRSGAGVVAAAADAPDPPYDDLVERLVAATGADIRVHGHLEDTTPARTAIVRSVVREALTNSLRHAPGRPIDITLSERGVEVLTRGDGRSEPTDQRSGHHGLAGLRERVEAQDGELAAGAVPEGWRLSAYWQA